MDMQGDNNNATILAFWDSYMDFKDVLNRRYPCRMFAAQGAEKDKLDRILEAGRMV